METGFDTFIHELSTAPDETIRDAADGEAARVGDIKNATLDALAEMRAVGMNFIRRRDKRAAGEMNEIELKGMKRVGDDCVAFERMARAVRQIIALEQETVGDGGRGSDDGLPQAVPIRQHAAGGPLPRARTHDAWRQLALAIAPGPL